MISTIFERVLNEVFELLFVCLHIVLSSSIIEVVAVVVRADETTVAEPLENSVDRIAVIVAQIDDLGDGSRLVEIIKHLKGLTGQQFGEINVGVLADVILVDFDGRLSEGTARFRPLSRSVHKGSFSLSPQRHER